MRPVKMSKSIKNYQSILLNLSKLFIKKIMVISQSALGGILYLQNLCNDVTSFSGSFVNKVIEGMQIFNLVCVGYNIPFHASNFYRQELILRKIRAKINKTRITLKQFFKLKLLHTFYVLNIFIKDSIVQIHCYPVLGKVFVIFCTS